jgi:hypothetical protein
MPDMRDATPLVLTGHGNNRRLAANPSSDVQTLFVAACGACQTTREVA